MQETAGNDVCQYRCMVDHLVLLQNAEKRLWLLYFARSSNQLAPWQFSWDSEVNPLVI